MSARWVLFCAIICVVVAATLSLSTANCPAASRIDSCSPQCKEHSNCQGGKVCCSNICGSKTCTDVNQYLSGNKGDKYSSSNKYGSTGAYCGNQKCGPNEKCELDRSTKRQKCVRN